MCASADGRPHGHRGAAPRRGVDEGLVVKEAVLRHMVEGMRSELVREVLGWVGV